jgi:hypothetical protein
MKVQTMGLREIWAQAQKNPAQAFSLVRTRALCRTLRWYNALAIPQSSATKPSGVTEFDEVRARSLQRGNINDHLLTLFTESIDVQPRLIVELGVGGGESTFAFERVARLCGSKLISVDLQNCAHVSSCSDWLFVKSDDIAFAAEFASFCRSHGIASLIDVLFIDTSHELEHTKKEIKTWFPFLSAKSVVFFHDTNVRRIYWRRDGSLGVGYNNERGVIAAVEAFLGVTFNERRDFVDVAKGWLIRHYASCSGLTILKKQSSLTAGTAPTMSVLPPTVSPTSI